MRARPHRGGRTKRRLGLGPGRIRDSPVLGDANEPQAILTDRPRRMTAADPVEGPAAAPPTPTASDASASDASAPASGFNPRAEPRRGVVVASQVRGGGAHGRQRVRGGRRRDRNRDRDLRGVHPGQGAPPRPRPRPQPPTPRSSAPPGAFVRSFADDASPAPLTTPLPPLSSARGGDGSRARARDSPEDAHHPRVGARALPPPPGQVPQGTSRPPQGESQARGSRPRQGARLAPSKRTHPPGKVRHARRGRRAGGDHLLRASRPPPTRGRRRVTAGRRSRVGTRRRALRFSARVPTDAPSSFYVAGGNWNVGTGYLAEIVYTVSATVVGPESYAAGRDASTTREHEWRERLSVGSRFDAAALARGEAATAAAKRHFLVAQRSASPYASPGSNPAAGPASSGSRSFITGGALRASATLDKPAYAPGGDVAVCKVEANCTAGQPCAFVGSSAACGMALTAGTQRWAQNFDLTPTKHEGYPPGYHGERWLPFRVPPGWPSSTSGKLVRCAYGFRVTFSLPATLNLTLDLPVVILPTASMYASARPAGAPYVGGEEGQPPAPELPPGIVFRPLWVADAACPTCRSCFAPFTVFNRRHHCRHCGSIFCKKCAGGRVLLPRLGYDTPQRVCRGCFSEAYRTGGSFAPAEERKSDGGDGGGGERRRGVRRWDARGRGRGDESGRGTRRIRGRARRRRLARTAGRGTCARSWRGRVRRRNRRRSRSRRTRCEPSLSNPPRRERAETIVSLSRR